MADTTSSIPIQQPLINNVEQSQEEKKSSVPSAIFNLVKSITGMRLPPNRLDECWTISPTFLLRSGREEGSNLFFVICFITSPFHLSLISG